MKTILRSTLATLGLTFVASSAHAEAPKCHKDAAKLEWYVCGVKPVEYKRGMKTETRDECAVNERIKTASPCDLGDLVSKLPPDIDPANVYFYAIGPKDLDATVGFEGQLQTERPACRLSNDVPSYWQLGKFSDAFDKDDRERSEVVEQKLAAAGKRVVGGMVLGAYKDSGCAGKKATFGMVDSKTFSEVLWYSETTFN